MESELVMVTVVFRSQGTVKDRMCTSDSEDIFHSFQDALSGTKDHKVLKFFGRSITAAFDIGEVIAVVIEKA